MRLFGSQGWLPRSWAKRVGMKKKDSQPEQLSPDNFMENYETDQEFCQL